MINGLIITFLKSKMLQIALTFPVRQQGQFQPSCTFPRTDFSQILLGIINHMLTFILKQIWNDLMTEFLTKFTSLKKWSGSVKIHNYNMQQLRTILSILKFNLKKCSWLSRTHLIIDVFQKLAKFIKVLVSYKLITKRPDIRNRETSIRWFTISPICYA